LSFIHSSDSHNLILVFISVPGSIYEELYTIDGCKIILITDFCNFSEVIGISLVEKEVTAVVPNRVVVGRRTSSQVKSKGLESRETL